MDIYYVTIIEEVQYDAMIEESRQKIIEFIFESLNFVHKEATIKVRVTTLKIMREIFKSSEGENLEMISKCKNNIESINISLDGFNQELLAFEGRLQDFLVRLQKYQKKQTKMPAHIKKLLGTIIFYTASLQFITKMQKKIVVDIENFLNECT